MAIDYSAITEAVRVWLRDATALPDGQVILQDQAGPQLQPPYATVKIGSTSKPFSADYVGHNTDLTQPAGQEVERFITGPRQIIASLQVYTKGTFGGAGATALLSNARDQLELGSVMAAFSAAGFAVNDVSDVRNLSALLTTNFQGRAHLELTLAASSHESERTGYIASVSGTGTVENDAGDPISISYSATLPP